MSRVVHQDELCIAITSNRSIILFLLQQKTQDEDWATKKQDQIESILQKLFISNGNVSRHPYILVLGFKDSGVNDFIEQSGRILNTTLTRPTLKEMVENVSSNLQ